MKSCVYIWAGILLLLSAVSGWAGVCGTIKMPPPEYSKPQLVKPAEVTMDYWSVDAYCRSIGVKPDGKGRIEGCNSRRVVYLPTIGTGGVTEAYQGCVRDHEYAHLAPNYWPYDHPGAVWK